MKASILCPCYRCSNLLPGVRCIPRYRARCEKFLDYIQILKQIKAHRILFKELKDLIPK